MAASYSVYPIEKTLMEGWGANVELAHLIIRETLANDGII